VSGQCARGQACSAQLTGAPAGLRGLCARLIRRLAGLEERADGLQLKVLKRGAPPGGGGEVHVSVPVVKALPPVSLMEEGAPLCGACSPEKALVAPPLIVARCMPRMREVAWL
jgi:RNA 3'-terminal phosphate cyclase